MYKDIFSRTDQSVSRRLWQMRNKYLHVISNKRENKKREKQQILYTLHAKRRIQAAVSQHKTRRRNVPFLPDYKNT